MAEKKKNIISEEEALAICKKWNLEEESIPMVIEEAVYREIREIDRDLLDINIQQEIEWEKEFQIQERGIEEYDKKLEETYKNRSFLGKLYFDKKGRVRNLAFLFVSILIFALVIYFDINYFQETLN